MSLDAYEKAFLQGISQPFMADAADPARIRVDDNQSDIKRLAEAVRGLAATVARLEKRVDALSASPKGATERLATARNELEALCALADAIKYHKPFSSMDTSPNPEQIVQTAQDFLAFLQSTKDPSPPSAS